MADYLVSTGQGPILVVQLQKGESLLAESDAMVVMDASLELSGEMRGGFLASLGRTMVK
jgi:uncharacterized protein (AIM24 family)